MLDKRFSVECTRKNLGWNLFGRWRLPCPPANFPVFEEPVAVFPSLPLRYGPSQQNSRKAQFLGTGSAIVFCFAVCFGFDSRYSVNDSTARSICGNGVQQLGVFVGASKCFSHKVEMRDAIRFVAPFLPEMQCKPFPTDTTSSFGRWP